MTERMDLRQLRYFVTVAERGGFGAAASALNVAQSALSRHVRLLEHELGGALLERGARGVAVTEAGKVLLARGRWLLGAFDDIKAEVLTENREPSGTVRLGAPSSLADILYAPLAQLFAERFPKVQLELSDGLTEEMTDRLLRAELGAARGAVESGRHPLCAARAALRGTLPEGAARIERRPDRGDDRPPAARRARCGSGRRRVWPTSFMRRSRSSSRNASRRCSSN